MKHKLGSNVAPKSIFDYIPRATGYTKFDAGTLGEEEHEITKFFVVTMVLVEAVDKEAEFVGMRSTGNDCFESG